MNLSKEYRLKHLFSKRIGGAWGTEPDENAVVCLRAADILTDQFSHKIYDLTYRTFSDQELISRKLRLGDIIIEKSGGGENQPVGRIAKFILEDDALCSNFLDLLRPDNEIVTTDYISYILYNLWKNRTVVKSIKQTTGIQNLDIEDYFDNKIKIPAISQQNKIVDYLDHEVAKIDTLIEKKNQLITILEEKKKAVINQAVTKGLDPNVSMKDSGIKWLGEIPKHWQLVKLKYVSNLKSGDFLPAENIKEEGDFKVFGGNGERGYFDNYNHEGDLVLIGRQGALCGNINFANGKFWATEHAIVCNPIALFDYYWLGKQLESMNLNQYSLAAAQPGLSVDVIKNLFIVFPPINEQHLISNYLLELDKRNGLAVKKITDSIDLLKEKRAAIISAAVNGELNASL
jgi:type I restriction enzyme S subunit